jgi:signal transduction histidine kinase
MPNLSFIFDMAWLIGLLSILLLFLNLLIKLDKIKQLQKTVDSLKKSLEEMDEQAKLIVRTDIELNKTQEELDKKITGLFALQRLSRAISTTLEENQIFKMINTSHLEDLGFEKACAFLWSDPENKFIAYLNVGYLEDEIEKIQSALQSDKNMYLNLIKNAKAISSISLIDSVMRDKVERAFLVNSFVISSLIPKEGNKGFLFVGTENRDMPLTEGDEELITILSNQIGQALENARLFEKTWKAHQELENKVEERTRQLSLALDEVRMASKRKTDFISSVSHELRTPLTSIKGYASILIEEKLGQLPQAVKDRLTKINHHSNELVNMVNDLLDIVRIEAGKTVMKMEKQDINNLINSASDLVSIQCKNKNIELAQDIQKDLPPVLADASQIERVLINLLANAVKFTPQNGRITVKAYRKEQNIQFQIQDTGIGIPPESLHLIFDEFYRVDNPINLEVKGTGLGLSLAKNIVEAHKGKIWAESQVNKGATFNFTLPIT